MPALADIARPQSWQEVAGNAKAVAQVQRVLKLGWGGRAWFIVGNSGQGKTSIARLIAHVGAGPNSVEEIDGQDCTMDMLRKIDDEEFSMRSMEKPGGKCWIINEAQGMRASIADRWLTLLEGGRNFDKMPDHCCLILTSSKPLQPTLFGDEHDGAALFSRCQQVTLRDDAQTRQALARRALEVAKAHDMDGLPPWAYEAALERKQGNLRAVLQLVEADQVADVAREEIQEYLRKPMKEQEPQRRALLQARLAELEGQCVAAAWVASAPDQGAIRRPGRHATC